MSSLRNIFLSSKGKKEKKSKKKETESNTDFSNSIVYRTKPSKQSIEKTQFSQNPQENYFYIPLEKFNNISIKENKFIESVHQVKVFTRLQDAIESINAELAMSTSKTEPKILRVTLDPITQAKFIEEETNHLTMQDKDKITIIEHMDLALAKIICVLDNFDKELITDLKPHLTEEEHTRILEIIASTVNKEEKGQQLYQFINLHKNQSDLMDCIKSKYFSLIQAENKEASTWAKGCFYIFFSDSPKNGNSFPYSTHSFQINGSLENTIKRNINNLISTDPTKIPQIAKVKIFNELEQKIKETRNTNLSSDDKSQIRIIKYMDIDLAKMIAFADIKGLIAILEQHVGNGEEGLENLQQIEQMIATKETKVTEIYGWLKSKQIYDSSQRGSTAVEGINKVKSYINKEVEKATSTFFYIPFDNVSKENTGKKSLPEGNKYIFDNLNDTLQYITNDNSKKQKDPRIAKVKILNELELAENIKKAAGKLTQVDPKEISVVVGYINPNLAKMLCCIDIQELTSFLKKRLSKKDCDSIDKIVTSTDLDEKEKLEEIYHWLEQKKNSSVPESLHKKETSLKLKIQILEDKMLNEKIKLITTVERDSLLKEQKTTLDEICNISREQQSSIKIAKEVYDFVEKKYQENLTSKKTGEKPQESPRARNYSIFEPSPDSRRPSSPPLSTPSRSASPPPSAPGSRRPSSPNGAKDKRFSAMFNENFMSTKEALKPEEERSLLKK